MIIAIAILIAPAKATPVDVRFCIDYAMSITGASSTVGDDYYTSNDETYPAYGAHITVDEIGGSYLYTGYLATSGTYAGCTPALTLEYGTGLSAPKYSVIMRSENWIDGAWINLRNNETDYQHYSFLASGLAGYKPPAGGETKNYATPIAVYWSAMAMITGAYIQVPFGGANPTLDVYMNEGCAGGIMCCPEAGTLYAGSATTLSKSHLIHEMGHCWTKSYGFGSTADYSIDDDPCIAWYSDPDSPPRHEMNSKEYQGSAFHEGAAQFYIAGAYNDGAESDCSIFFYTRPNWDLSTPVGDDNGVDDDETNIVNCEGGMPTLGVPAGDYLGNMCDAPLANRGTEYDWMRFFWDLYTDQGLTTDQIMTIVANSDPDNWSTYGITYGPGKPSYEMRQSAIALGLGTKWDNEDNENGVQR